MRSYPSARQQLVIAALLCALSFPADAAAAETNGLLIGTGRLHLGLAVEGGQDTNVTYVPAKDAVSDYLLHIKPMLKLSVPSEVVSFDIGTTLDVLRYFGATDSKTADLSTLQALASVRTVFNSKGKFVFFLLDDLVRSADPRPDGLGAFAHTVNTAGAGFDWKPGGGMLLINVNYSFFFDIFDSDTGLSSADSYAHQPSLNFKWAFFPRTAFVLGASADARRYPNTGGSLGGQAITNSDLNAIRTYVGVMGMITPRLSMNVRAGYGNSLATTAGAKNFQSGVGLAEFQYDLAAQTRFTLGYTRDFQPAPIYGYYATDRIRASATQGLFGKLTLTLDASVDLQNFGEQVDATGKSFGTRSDVMTSVAAAIDYQIISMLTVGVSDAYQLRSSSFSAGGSSSISKNVALVKLTFYY